MIIQIIDIEFLTVFRVVRHRLKYCFPLLRGDSKWYCKYRYTRTRARPFVRTRAKITTIINHFLFISMLCKLMPWGMRWGEREKNRAHEIESSILSLGDRLGNFWWWHHQWTVPRALQDRQQWNSCCVENLFGNVLLGVIGFVMESPTITWWFWILKKGFPNSLTRSVRCWRTWTSSKIQSISQVQRRKKNKYFGKSEENMR